MTNEEHLQRRQRVFAIGQTVVLSASVTWRDPKVQRRVHQQRPGTITSVIGTKLPPGERGYTIRFDPIRKGADPVFVHNVAATWLDLTELQQR